ncbi:thiolase family protein [Ramlibacter sp. PS4R-6]|uniref:thiolase family protein n=1 Tax=Ramlibacter sp. PS4R-6 TaxID=3133438 RepID=UPI0030B488AE
MTVYIVGLGLHPPSRAERGLRLEEMAWRTSRAALESAGVSRRQLDSVTLGACDEMDGRPISSMLMTAPAGGYGTDEIKVTDSGATALALAYARVLAGESNLGLVVSWCKTSKTDIGSVFRLRGEPFYTRPLGIDDTVADALFAQAVAAEFDVSDGEANQRVLDAYTRAARNPRGIGHDVPTRDAVAASAYEATPLRAAQRAPHTDGAVALALASEQFLRSNPGVKPLARIAGIGWATDEYRLDGQRLRAMKSARTAWQRALKQAGLRGAGELDAVELESQTAWHEAAYVRAFGIERKETVSPSGGAFAQNPLFCTGLVNAAEAVLQVSGRAGAVQRPGVKRAAAHGCHGYAQQGNVVMVFEGTGATQ